MNIEVRAYTDNDIEAMVTIWNQVVEDGEAFPQEECLTQSAGTCIFLQSRHIAESRRIWTQAESTACISYIQTM